MAKKENRFIVIHKQSGGFSGPATYILVDQETGVHYLYANSGYGAGLTALLDKDGKPITTPVENTQL